MLSQVIYGRRESQEKQQLTANRWGLPTCGGPALRGTDKKDDSTWNPLLEAQKGRKTKKAANKKIGSSADSRGGACAVRAPRRGNRATPASPANGVGQRQNAQRSCAQRSTALRLGYAGRSPRHGQRATCNASRAAPLLARASLGNGKMRLPTKWRSTPKSASTDLGSEV